MWRVEPPCGAGAPRSCCPSLPRIRWCDRIARPTRERCRCLCRRQPPIPCLWTEQSPCVPVGPSPLIRSWSTAGRGQPDRASRRQASSRERGTKPRPAAPPPAPRALLGRHRRRIPRPRRLRPPGCRQPNEIGRRHSQPRRTGRIQHLEGIRNKPQAMDPAVDLDLVGYLRNRGTSVKAHEVLDSLERRSIEKSGSASPGLVVNEKAVCGQCRRVHRADQSNLHGHSTCWLFDAKGSCGACRQADSRRPRSRRPGNRAFSGATGGSFGSG